MNSEQMYEKYENLFKIYDKVMYLKMYIDSNDDVLKSMYLGKAIHHNNKLISDPSYIDAGFDLYAPGKIDDESDNVLKFYKNRVNKLDFEVICSAKIYNNSNKSYNTGYYMYPRSSLSKTMLRLANSVGIIDAGYRGHLIGMFDVINNEENSQYTESFYNGNIYDRYLQICAPGLLPIIVEIVKNKEDLGEETERGEGGFGSTGK
jgi:hypothetical protein